MSLRRVRLTNFYYSRSSPQSDPGITWDSDSSVTRAKIADSPRFAEWFDYLSRRATQEEFHEKWKNEISKSETLSATVYNACGWRVRMLDTIVWYTYRPRIDENHVDNVRFKIKFKYLRPVRRWFINLGHSSLPEIEDWSKLRRKFKKGYDYPLHQSILSVLDGIGVMIDHYMLKKRYVDEFLDSVNEHYPKLKVEFDKTLENLTVVYGAGSEEVWIPRQRKTTVNDSVTVRMVLDSHFIAESVHYDYKYEYSLPFENRRRLEKRLERRLHVFMEVPLKQAFKDIMSD